MSRTTESSQFVIPPALARQAAKIAREEGRSSGALFGEMLRTYKIRRKQRVEYDEAWAMQLILETQEEERRHPTLPGELRKEGEELRRYGIAQAKKLGLASKDIDKLLQKPRPRRKLESGS